jgi:hypothetical protein
MDLSSLISGYKRVINQIYSPQSYYQRLRTFFNEYRPVNKKRKVAKITPNQVQAFLKSIWFLGIKEKERIYYWKLFFWGLFRKPKLFPTVIDMTIKGFHFRKISENYLRS